MFFVASRATLTISSSTFDKARIVVARNGVLTIRNTDRKPYALTVGATPLTVRAKSTASLGLPQQGTFSIVCAKWPSLAATVVVK